MTLFDLARAAVRLWGVTLAGAAITATMVFAVSRAPGLYWARVDVLFVASGPVDTPSNGLSRSATRVIEMASVVQRHVDGIPDASVVSDGVSIVDEGFQSGTEVRLPNAGGQWANNFNRAYLDVQVVDGSATAANARLTDVLARIYASVDRLQTAAEVDAANRVTLQLNPLTPQVRLISGQNKKAALLMAALGIGLTAAGIVFISQRRRPYRRQQGESRNQDPARRRFVGARP
jgi:hypothetical protein